jgi:hypothetical protein
MGKRNVNRLANKIEEILEDETLEDSMNALTLGFMNIFHQAHSELDQELQYQYMLEFLQHIKMNLSSVIGLSINYSSSSSLDSDSIPSDIN